MIIDKIKRAIKLGENMILPYEGLDLIGWTLNSKSIPQKQTYEEYVEERLRVERLMK